MFWYALQSFAMFCNVLLQGFFKQVSKSDARKEGEELETEVLPFAMLHNVLQCFAMFHNVLQSFAMFCNVLQCSAMFYNVLQCFTMFCCKISVEK